MKDIFAFKWSSVLVRIKSSTCAVAIYSIYESMETMEITTPSEDGIRNAAAVNSPPRVIRSLKADCRDNRKNYQGEICNTNCITWCKFAIAVNCIVVITFVVCVCANVFAFLCQRESNVIKDVKRSFWVWL